MAIEPPDPVAENKPVTASEEVQSVIAGEGAESDFAVEQPKSEPQQPVRAMDRKKHVETKRSKTPAKAREEGRTAETRVKGGVASRGSADRAASGGRVSASAGSIAGYASRVRARVAANKPSASGRGTAVISFRVTSGGGLAFARLARSSGAAAIDQAALAAVRRSAPFPTPPAGASPGQLAFTIPFHFR
jgi:protein TonB